ncbi:aminopeptidase [Advenella sp. S44]|uniref:DmpA family aminopeptidase n=1 Tax=Advenella sp. S44 TaxID=1982755 RepID=UPI000C29DBC7|nr:P1 family peptidase [Advenella sp. S44]PJX25432.1 aminopeptidase [Advenella sp. S44]
MTDFDNQLATVTAPVVGILPAGPHNRITDVPGVKVGHVTLARGAIQTGVTVIYPHADDLFLNKVAAGASVINGFGKSTGLLQLQELGVIETPLALTNTFSVPIVAQAQIRQAIAANPKIGREWPTVNPLVLECNDGYLNDIQAMAVAETDYLNACANAAVSLEQGAVGAGRGMSSFGLKGGIGTASRIAQQEGSLAASAPDYIVGALVLSNFGKLRQLRVNGSMLGLDIKRRMALRAATRQPTPGIPEDSPDKGSIIIVLATDAPLDARQLRRLSLRAAAGLARTGSSFGHGSGDIAIAFAPVMRTGEQLHAVGAQPAPLHEVQLDPLFDAAAEATEQAIINSLWSASAVTGRDGNTRLSITDWLHD